MEAGSKERFLKIYANLPLGVRQEIILVLENKPITWDVAFLEIDQDTEVGKIILEKLERFEII